MEIMENRKGDTMIDAALVLEGGSLRCLFTAGVLDVLMEQGIELSYVMGVSAGSLSGINYVSKQIGRTARININYVNDNRYLGIRCLLKERSIFNFNFLFDDIAKELDPFDFDAFCKSEQEFIAVATSCETGEARYFDKENCADIMMAARASSSMPLLSRKVEVNKELCLDGGVAMPIPYQKAIDDGYEKVVLVLTREHGYRKPEQGRAMLKAYERAYHEYPKFIERLKHIPDHYNEMQEEIDELERQGKIFVIRPEVPVLVSRVEKDTDKLKDLYQIGRNIATKQLEAFKAYLGA